MYADASRHRPDASQSHSLIGVLSDTHGKLPPEVRELFLGVDRVIHAGDAGGPDVLAELELIAPLTAVRGNMDAGSFGWSLPLVATLDAGGVGIRVAHEMRDALREPLGPDVRVVVTGHTHVPHALVEGGVLHLNPGSPTRARRGSGHHVALLRIARGVPIAEILSL